MKSLQEKVYSAKKGGAAYGNKIGHYNNAATRMMGHYNTPVKMLGHYNGLTGGGKSNIHNEIYPKC